MDGESVDQGKKVFNEIVCVCMNETQKKWWMNDLLFSGGEYMA